MQEETINLYGKTYKQITYDTGEQILKRFDDKYKMWVTLRFTQDEDTNVLNLIKQTTKNALLNTIQT